MIYPSNFSTRCAQATSIACAVVALVGCSKSPTDVATATPASSAAMVAMNTQPTTNVAPSPAPVVIAPAPQPNANAYEQGRRDQQRSDARHERHEQQGRDGGQLAPRADRDGDVARASRDDAWRGQQVSAARCADCGVIESVDAVQVQGANNGVGAVAGGLGGALVGNRIAGNHNRALGGVIGAVGGGLLGNAIEKHERVTTAYDVHVRMEDGSLRTIRQTTSPAIGSKVRVEADGLHDRA